MRDEEQGPGVFAQGLLEDRSGIGGYRLVLRDRALLACAGLNTLLSAASFSQMNSALPAWANGPVGLTPRIVGLAFLANTIVIGLAQLFVLRYLLPGRRRTRAVAAAAVLFGTAWLIILSARNFHAQALAAGALIGGLSIFGLGETLLSPSLPALVNDLAEESLRGRYNAVYSLSWQIGPIIGPVTAGFMLSRGLGVTHFLGLALACALAAALAVRIERVVPAEANRA
ncbi:MAG TPA: MFS transporter [Tepidisphaeraceae bacterium]|nr:MFS transporter [Tepidisphaeraceae bacterium]